MVVVVEVVDNKKEGSTSNEVEEKRPSSHKLDNYLRNQFQR